MAISTYTELQTAIANWLDRDVLTARLPEYISLCEAKLNRRLKNAHIREMETTATGTLSSGTDVIAFESDHLTLTKVQINASTTIILEPLSKEMLMRKYPTSTTGTPKFFALNGNQLEVRPTADADYTYELSHIQKIPALSSNSTNWLLSLYPDAYLYGSLLEAKPYLEDMQDAAVWKQLFDGVVMEIIESNDRFAGGTLMMRSI